MYPDRTALAITTDTFSDTSFSDLRSVRVDASSLVEVLEDPRIGGFAPVRLVANQPAQQIREEIEAYLSTRTGNDFALIYLSGHGMKSATGEFYFIATDTKQSLLRASGVSASFLQEQVQSSPAHSTLIMIDCCFSGAYPRGYVPRAAPETRIDELLQGRGHAVLTASNAIEHAFEGAESVDLEVAPSVFTNAVIDGLRTGLADIDADGMISIADLHQFVVRQVRASGMTQTPKLFSFVDGPIMIARNPFFRPQARRMVDGGSVSMVIGRGLSQLLGSPELVELWREMRDLLVQLYRDTTLDVLVLELMDGALRLPGTEGLLQSARSARDALQDVESSYDLDREVDRVVKAMIQLSIDAGTRTALTDLGTTLVGLGRLVSDLLGGSTLPKSGGLLAAAARRMLVARLRDLVQHYRAQAEPETMTSDGTGPSERPGRTAGEVTERATLAEEPDEPVELRQSLRHITIDIRNMGYAVRDLTNDPWIAGTLRTITRELSARPAEGKPLPSSKTISRIFLVGGALRALTHALRTSYETFVEVLDELISAGSNEEIPSVEEFDTSVRRTAETTRTSTGHLIEKLRLLLDPVSQQEVTRNNFTDFGLTSTETWEIADDVLQDVSEALLELADEMLEKSRS